MPLFVLAHSRPFIAPFAGWPAEEMERIMLSLQGDLARLVPDARFANANQSGHNIHQEQPELVIEAIREVVMGVRNPDTWHKISPCCRP
jgi:pimeloyl-ACP methyl ester carboxylesterase